MSSSKSNRVPRAAKSSSARPGRADSHSVTTNNTRPSSTNAATGPRTTSARGGTGVKKRGKNTSDLLRAREEEYRRMNEELEMKTATLVKEAEDIMKEHISFISNESFTSDQGDSRTTAQSRSLDAKGTPKEEKTRTELHKEDMTFSMNEDIGRAVLQMEQRLASEDTAEDIVSSSLHIQQDDVVPDAAEQMGTEALMRFLKAKLRVLQEEVDRLTTEANHKDKLVSSAETKVKDIVDQNNKLQKSHQGLQLQLNKYKQLSSQAQLKCDGLEAQLVALRREIESMKSAQRKAASGHSAVEVRLNRALEEADKYKSELVQLRSQSKDINVKERKQIEELVVMNKKLERQKSELMTAFKKQMKLIDILKRQKIHTEAVKLLSFTEDEFIKSLDWKT